MVLDLGCGSGWLARRLARRGAFVYGLDVSRELLTPASVSLEDRLRSRVCWIEADAHCLLFGDASFDLVVGSGVLHHLATETAYAEVHRLPKSQGRAFFMEPLDQHPAVQLFRRLT